MMSGNRVLGAKYMVPGIGCWGEGIMSGNRVFRGKIYGVWEQGVWGPKEVGSNTRMAKIP
jgi:hypothetical protein